jgi:uncharacterized protein YqeY
MTLCARIQEDLKVALKQRDRTVVSTLRLLSASLKNESIAKRAELSDQDALKVVQRETKKRKEAIALYMQGGSEERVKQETAEMEILERYMPRQLDAKDLAGVVNRVIQESGATGPGDFGKVMKQVMQQVQGAADGRTVQEIVKQALAAPLE